MATAHTSAHTSPGRRAFDLLLAERGLVGVAILYAVGVSLLGLAIPVGVQAFVNTVAFGQLRQPVVLLALLVFVGL